MQDSTQPPAIEADPGAGKVTRVHSRALKADLTLIVVVIIWGATFVSVQNAIDEIPVHCFHVLRFGLATVVLLPMLWIGPGRTGKKSPPRLLWKAGLLAGLSLWGGYSFQTTGLLHTTPSHSGFLTGMAVVIVPLLAYLILKQKLERRVKIGVMMAAAGLALLSLAGSSSIEQPPPLPNIPYGDLLTFGCAICFAFQIIIKARWAGELSPIALTLVELGTVFMLSLAAALLLEEIPDPTEFSSEVWEAVVLTGILATAFAFLAQTWAQRTSTAVRTAVIFAFEPVTAAFFSWLLIGEVLSGWAVMGGMLIILGMLRTELGGTDDSTASNPDH